MNNKKQRKRFSVEEDLVLLRDIISRNPYTCDSKWELVRNVINNFSSKDFTVRCIREHVDYLLKLFRKEDSTNLRKSGTEEQYDEKYKLLQEVRDLQREFKSSTNTKKVGTNTRNMALGNQMQSEHVQSTSTVNFSDNTSDIVIEIPESDFLFSPDFHNGNSVSQTSTSSNSNIMSPTFSRNAKKRPLQQSALAYLQERNNTNLEIQKKQLELDERKVVLEEKKLKLEEEKFQLEKTERLHRIEIEIKEREHRLRVSEKQEELLNLLLNEKLKK